MITVKKKEKTTSRYFDSFPKPKNNGFLRKKNLIPEKKGTRMVEDGED